MSSKGRSSSAVVNRARISPNQDLRVAPCILPVRQTKCGTRGTTVKGGQGDGRRRARIRTRARRTIAMRFAGKAVIVTGGSKGIGEGCARVFFAEGGLVAILSRGKAAGEALAAELSLTGTGRAVYIPCDVADSQQLKSAIERAAAEFGRVDCLINNAGWHPPATTIDETRLEDLDRLIRLNFI